MRVAGAALTALVLLSGCGGAGGDKPEQGKQPKTIEEAAAAVAAGLSAGSLKDVPLRSGDPAADLPVLLRGLHGLQPKVTVQEVRRAGNTATVDFDYAWPLSTEWTYETKATMVNESDTWKLVWEPAVLHPKLTAHNRLERSRTSTDRGTITGRGSTVLVQNTPLQMLGLNKAAVPDPGDQQASAETIANQLNLDPVQFLEKVRAAGANAFVDAAPVRTEEIPANFTRTKGADSRTVTLPAAKSAGYAQALLGGVGYAGEKEVAESGGTVYPGDVLGTSGLQKTFDAKLRGRGGNKVFLAPRDSQPGSGRPTSDTLVADFPDAPGGTLETTIDDDVQSRVEQAVGKVKQPVSVAVIRVGNGAILAAADSPAARARNESTTARIAPGMANANVTALALLRSGVRLNDKVTCEKSVTVEGLVVENPKGFSYNGSSMTLEQALARGCRTAVAQAAGRLQADELSRAAQSLGMGRTVDLGTPNNLGAVERPTGARATAETAIGQGPGVQASALALAVQAASVQAKKPITPVLVPERTPLAADGVPPLTEAESKALQAMMKASPGSYGNFSNVVTGEADGRQVLVGYSDAFAVAIVIGNAGDSSAPSLSTLGRAITSTGR
ncbi:penicillin-binding transpeptidase domain-containing protein [Enemella dayhoffiae]|uniref:penicillin-binding transpeptidase domain-containing protein n=1 Tax=Enemella dayhoffiae TaxID=2016507 RepID=UPI00159633F2|nr:penicillin-binding transpeptidase domain-containing protein [Enemella dayhoffiae]